MWTKTGTLYVRGTFLRNGLPYAASWLDRAKILWGAVKWPLPVDCVVKSPVGVFHLTDMGRLNFLRPGWEAGVRSIISSLRCSLFVDVGANIGLYSVIAGRNGNDVISFEPEPRTYSFLKENLSKNEVATSEAYNCAAWDSEGFVDLKKGWTTAWTQTVEGSQIRATTVDSVLRGRVPGLVKIDVEGSELKVLQGMRETLETANRPKIIFEARTGTKLHESTDFLQRYGYRITTLDKTDFLAEVTA